MSHEETIRIYRSDVSGAEPPSLTYGELAANLADRKVFVGGPGGTADMIVLSEVPDTGVTGISAGHTGIAVSGITGFVQIFNMGVLSVNGVTGHVNLDEILIAGATGDTVLSGIAIDVVRGADNTVTINNLGVTSFNGLTGSVFGVSTINSVSPLLGEVLISILGDNGAIIPYTPEVSSGNIVNLGIGARIATASVTGVASFPATFFTVTNGAVGLSGVYGTVGVTGITSGVGISISSITGNVQINNMGVTSFNGLTGAITYAPPLATTGASGVASFSSSNFVVSTTGHVSLQPINVTDLADFDTASLADADGFVMAYDTNLSDPNQPFYLESISRLYSPRLATGSLTGVASFPATFFSVANGAVSLSGPYGVIGVTGLSAGHTGIALVGTTGNVRIFNMGVLSVDGSTGHIDATRIRSIVGPTGDTVQAGQFITIGTGKTINNVGVQTFNGLTGVVSMTGDNGAIIGVSNNTIRARLATDSLTGVASFPATFFTVGTNGAVGLSGVYGTIGVTGLSAGHTGIALVGTTGNVRIFNMGVHTFNGQTGHVSFSVGATGDTVLPGSGIVIPETLGNTKTIINVGVTGISAGHTGISFSGTTGNIQVFNMGVLSVNGVTGHVDLDQILIQGATGDTVKEGIAIDIVRAGNDVTINNIGVTSFNGLTGAISYAPAIASVGASGVASFLSRDFTVSGTGHVSLLANSIDINGGDGINVVGEGKVELGQGVTIRNTGVTSFNGSTGSISLINFVQGDGIATQAVSNKVVFTNIGVTSLNGLTGARTLTGDGGAIIGAANTQIGARLATTGATGVASFDGNIFTVTAGKVGLTDGGIINRYLVNSNIKITTGIGSGLAGGDFVSLGGDISLVNVGVTGMSAGHTGISLIGTTGNVRIFNMGVLSVDGSTGHIDATRIRQIVGPTGDTVQAGQFITIGANKTINNVGVQTFNGLTGAVSMTGDNGAIIGVSNNTIRARLATDSLTGVASFLPKFFDVINGAVGLSGVYGTIGVTGLSAGHTGIALVGTTGNVRIFNMGVLSVNGNTGHISADTIRNIVGPTGDTVQAGQFITIDANKTINNVGVQTFNGLTGAVSITGDGGALIGASNNTIRARLADHSTTGVASFLPKFFEVANGAVGLSGVYGTIGVTGLSAGHTGIALVGTTGNVHIFNMGILSINGQTGHYTLPAVGNTGDTVLAGNGIFVSNPSPSVATVTNIGVTSILRDATTITGDIKFNPGRGITFAYGTGGLTFANTGVLTINDQFPVDGNFIIEAATVITGDGGALVGDGVRILARIAGNSVTGVASFNPAFFTVSDIGAVGLSGVYGTIGVTGLSAGHTGISLIGTTGNVRIFNMGVLSVDGSTGHIDATRIRQIVGPTGDTVQAGQFITIGTGKTINNVGVQTLNGLTGARTLTGDGGAIVGASNNIIRARLAENGVTGVASFSSTNFNVSAAGAVSIKANGVPNTALSFDNITINTFEGSGLAGGGNVALGGTLTLSNAGVTSAVAGSGIRLNKGTGEVIITNIGVTGISAGHTGIALDGTTGNVRIFNMGILSINGQTGHYTLPAVGATGDTVVAGSGIVIPETSGNTRTIINVGVTGISAGHTGISFSGTTGNVQVFNMGVLSVDGSTGHVSATRIRQIVGPTGDTVQAGQFITIDANKTINNVGVQTFNGLTGVVSMTGDNGAIIGVSNNTIRARLATDSLTGVASFPATFFTVGTNGAVGLSGVYGTIGVTGLSAGHTGIALVGTTGNVRIFNMGVHTFNGQTGHITFSVGETGNTVVAGSGIVIPTSSDNTKTIINVGVTGIGFGNDAGLTGKINLTASGNITMVRSGNLITVGSDFSIGATGDTVVAGVGISAVKSGVTNVVTINNMGVTSFNGLTGAVSMTGDGGAIIGASNNTIRARLADYSVTGVASFFSSDFGVSTTGHVSLTGNVARTNISNTFNAFQFFPQGFNTAKGVTFGSTTEPVNMSQNLNVAGNISAENLQSWIVSSSDTPLSPNRGVFANKSSGLLLLNINTNSSSYGVGSTVEVSGLTGSWRILIPNNHTVHFGNVTVAGSLLVDGFLESTHHRDSIRMVCCTKSGSTSQWNVLSSVGIINYGTTIPESFEGEPPSTGEA